MGKKRFLKEAGVLLLAIIMIFSSGIVIANKNNSYSISAKINTTNNSPVNRALVWDNVVGIHGDLGGIIVATVRTEGSAFPADDFKLPESQEVNNVFWQGGYFQCQLAQGEIDYHWDWRIIFWDDTGDGSHPGNEIYNQTFSDAVITREFWYNYTRPDTGNTYWVANYSVDLPDAIPFNADTTYWITIQGIQGTNAYPQACWSRHNITDGGIKLHEAVILAAWWGYPSWTNISVLVHGNLPHDLNYQLNGPFENNPPGAPTINGLTTKLKPNIAYDYTLNAVDPETNDVYYYVDWGDGNTSGWVGPSGSGVDAILNHSWTASKTYTVKAKAKDVYDAESGWTTITVTVPRFRSTNNLLQKILVRFPNAFPILRHLLML